MSIASYLLDKSVYDDLLEMVEHRLDIYNYIDYLNVKVSLMKNPKDALIEIISYLVGTA